MPFHHTDIDADADAYADAEAEVEVKAGFLPVDDSILIATTRYTTTIKQDVRIR